MANDHIADDRKKVRLIDANEISYHKSGFPKGDGFDSRLDWAFREDIDKIPTVDAIPVVRCKDCKHRCNGKDCAHPLLLSYSWGAIRNVKDNDFCSYGERRTNEPEEPV